MARPRVYPDEFRERAVRLVRGWRGPASKLRRPPGCSPASESEPSDGQAGPPDRAQLVVFAFESGAVWPSRIDEGRLAYRGCRTRRGELRPAR